MELTDYIDSDEGRMEAEPEHALDRICQDRICLDDAEHFRHNREANVVTLGWRSGLPRSAVRLVFETSRTASPGVFIMSAHRAASVLRPTGDDSMDHQ
jgi:hypothetical protein